MLGKSDYRGFISFDDIANHAGPATARLIRALEPILKVEKLIDATVGGGNSSREAWLASLAGQFGWTSSVHFAGPESELRALPNAIVFSNHGLGIRDSHVVATLMQDLFPNYIAPASTDFHFPPCYEDVGIAVDLHDGRKGANRRAALRIVQAVAKERKSLCIFPSGRIAQFRLRSMAIEERPWNPLFVWIARTCNTPLVPVCIHARLSALSHAVGVVSPTARLLLNAAEAQSRRLAHVELTVGRPIAPAQLTGDDDAQLRFLQAQVLQLHRAWRDRRGAAGRAEAAGEPAEIRS